MPFGLPDYGERLWHLELNDSLNYLKTTEEAHEADTSAHGVAGAVVGTTDAQVLTNKDLSSATNTFPASLATDAELAAHTGATVAHGVAGNLVGTTDTQALTNKDLSSGTNTFPASLATDAELTAHAGTTTGVHGVTGAVVGTTDTQTLSNKTLTAPAATGDLSAFGGAWIAYTPAWTSTSTLPALGNGTLVGAYMQIGKTVFYRIKLVTGSTTTYGAGTYLFSLPPVTPHADSAFVGGDIGRATIRDTSAAAHYGRTAYLNTTTTLALVSDSAAVVTNLSPVTFASGDIITIHGFYQAA